MTDEQHAVLLFTLLAIVFGVFIQITPVLAYLVAGWGVKKNEILNGLSENARKKYFEMFSLGTRRDERLLDFETFYAHYFGRRFFIAPTILLIVALSFACGAVGFTALHRLPSYRGVVPGLDLPLPAGAAVAGAYMWVTSDFISRARRLDFSPSDVHWGLLRLVVAIPMGYAFASVAAPSIAPAVCFALGAFPLGAIVGMLQKLFLTWTKQSATDDSQSDTVKKLQGIDDAIAARLAAEDITTVTQLAYCDPVRLVMRSNLTFNFVIDCMNQALAWLYFEDQLATLRPLGLRGAVEIAGLVDSLNSVDADEKGKAEATLKDVVVAVTPPHTIMTMRSTLDQIALDPFTAFLREVWVNPFTADAKAR